MESIEHLLFHCEWTGAVWFGCDLEFLSRRGVIHSSKEWTQSIIEEGDNASDRKSVWGKLLLWIGAFGKLEMIGPSTILKLIQFKLSDKPLLYGGKPVLCCPKI